MSLLGGGGLGGSLLLRAADLRIMGFKAKFSCLIIIKMLSDRLPTLSRRTVLGETFNTCEFKKRFNLQLSGQSTALFQKYQLSASPRLINQTLSQSLQCGVQDICCQSPLVFKPKSHPKQRIFISWESLQPGKAPFGPPGHSLVSGCFAAHSLSPLWRFWEMQPSHLILLSCGCCGALGLGWSPCWPVWRILSLG